MHYVTGLINCPRLNIPAVGAATDIRVRMFHFEVLVTLLHIVVQPFSSRGGKHFAVPFVSTKMPCLFRRGFCSERARVSIARSRRTK